MSDYEPKMAQTNGSVGSYKRVLPAPNAPMWVARALVKDVPTSDDVPHMKWWRGDFYTWTGARWEVMDVAELEGWLYQVTENAVYEGEEKGANKAVEKVHKFWLPTSQKIASVKDAMAKGVLFQGGDADRVIALENGVLDVKTDELVSHTPKRFNLHSLPFSYDPHAVSPQWLMFLDAILPGDPEAQQLLAEWFGYVVSGRRDLHKMLNIVGPPRSGKGTIARVLGALIGLHGMASPDLRKLGGQFGEASLIGKQLAIMSDVRWEKREVADAIQVLLAVIGEDARTVPRKNRDDWHGTLDVRFLSMSNDVPNFKDDSSAMNERMLQLELTHSFAGREDPSLTPRLLTELPGILNWALAGLQQLEARGYFVRPESARELTEDVARASSPVRAFVGDTCEFDPVAHVKLDDLHVAFEKWCVKERRDFGMTKDSFSRSFRNAFRDKVEVKRVGRAKAREQVAYGLRLAV